MSVNSTEKNYKKVLKSSTLLRSSVLTQNPIKPQNSQRRLSSMIKIGATNVFKISKPKTLSKDIKVRKTVKKEQKKAERPKSLESTFSFSLIENKDKSDKTVPLDIHGRKRFYRVKTKILKPLCKALTKIFNADDFNADELDLTETELHLVGVILKKRFGIDFLRSSVKKTSQNSSCKILSLYMKVAFLMGSNKREEENLKFVYKHTLKYLKSQFYEKNNLKYNKESEFYFYRFYFGEFAKTKGKPLNEFFDPLNRKKDSVKLTKTLSVLHLKSVFSCEKFKRDFFRYLGAGFKTDYQSSVFKKIEKIFEMLEGWLSKEKATEEIVKRFVKEFEKKKRIKFPWSCREIDVAVYSFIRPVQKISK